MGINILTYNFVENKNNGITTETGLDNGRTMGDKSQHISLGTVAESEGFNRTIKALNGAGSTGTVFAPEEREELEARGINSDYINLPFNIKIETKL